MWTNGVEATPAVQYAPLFFSPLNTLITFHANKLNSTAGVYRYAHYILNRYINCNFSFADRSHRFPYPLALTLFQQLFTCFILWVAAGLFQKLSATFLPETSGLGHTKAVSTAHIAHQTNTTETSREGAADSISRNELKCAESIESYSRRSVLLQLLPVAVVHTANITLSTWSFRYKAVIENKSYLQILTARVVTGSYRLICSGG
jgi:hypothetical protein